MDIPHLYELSTKPKIIICSSSEWLNHILNPTYQLSMGLFSDFFVHLPWTTQPRTPAMACNSHYLFYSPNAPISVTLLEGVTNYPAGTLIWIPPGMPYAIRLMGNSKVPFVRFRFQLEYENKQLSPFTAPHVFSASEQVALCLSHIGKEFRYELEHRALQFRLLIAQLSILAFRNENNLTSHIPHLRPQQCDRIHQFATSDFSKRISSTELAHLLQLSTPYFTRVFKTSLGVSPRDWLVEIRVQEGARLLMETDMNIDQIASSLGYVEARLFSRQFRKHFGKTPRDYRRL